MSSYFDDEIHEISSLRNEDFLVCAIIRETCVFHRVASERIPSDNPAGFLRVRDS